MDITSANAVITLTVPLIFPTPVRLQQFSTDDIYDTDDIDLVETSMGVDGNLTGGMVFTPVPQTFSFMADSPSVAIFETWMAQQIANVTTYTGNMRTRLDGIEATFVQTKGFLQKGAALPSAGKTLKVRKFTLIWQRVIKTPN